MKFPYKKYLRFAMILEQPGGNEQETHYPTPTKNTRPYYLSATWKTLF